MGHQCRKEIQQQVRVDLRRDGRGLVTFGPHFIRLQQARHGEVHQIPVEHSGQGPRIENLALEPREFSRGQSRPQRRTM